jgi:hypothetical protein
MTIDLKWKHINKISKLMDDYIIAKHYRDIERMDKITKSMRPHVTELNKIYGRCANEAPSAADAGKREKEI